MLRILTVLLPSLLVASIGMYFFSYYTPDPSPSAEVTRSIIGSSVEGREIESYTFGTGKTHIAIVGGIHGGYEWNTSLLAYELIAHFTENPETIPETHSLTIIPVANPDGLHAVAGTTTNLRPHELSMESHMRAHGRFNANGVDLNRNFDCKWKPESSWGTQSVSAGTDVFSEPEARALYGFVEGHSPDAFIFLHSKANAVYGAACHGEIHPETKALLDIYAQASGYAPIEHFDAYPITGDAESWLASLGIPAITVELKDHEDSEFEKNLTGITAVLEHFQDATQNASPLPRTEATPFYSY
jgi:hypothetical protein